MAVDITYYNTGTTCQIAFRVFGTTLSGTSVASQPRTQTIEFVSTLAN